MKNFIVTTLILFTIGVVFYQYYFNISDNRNRDGNVVYASQGTEKMYLKIGNSNYKVVLENNTTTKELAQKLPLTIDMSDLNGNEKYFYLPYSFSVKQENVKTIKTGDIMLFGDNCLVVFYKNFTTSYKYTRIGYIENPVNLEKVLGKGNIKVIFTK